MNLMNLTISCAACRTKSEIKMELYVIAFDCTSAYTPVIHCPACGTGDKTNIYIHED